MLIHLPARGAGDDGNVSLRFVPAPATGLELRLQIEGDWKNIPTQAALGDDFQKCLRLSPTRKFI